MKRMLRLQNATHVVFFEIAQVKQAESFRARNRHFTGRHIKDVIQAYPDQIEVGVVYERGKP